MCAMNTRQLGRTGLRVPPLCLGTMTFGLQCDEATSSAILDRAFEGGIDFIDTADVYPLGGGLDTVGRTEEIVGRWLRERKNRDRIVLATKCAGATGAGPNDAGLSRFHIMKAVDDSLRRLGTDVIDLYQVHSYDPRTPVDETLRALDDLVRWGKVRYAGCSNYPAWRLAEALATSERLGIGRYDCLQPRYNLLYREIETELLPLARSQGLGVIVYNPIAGGFLSGKYQKGEEPLEGTRFTLGNAGARYQQRYWQDALFDAVDALRGPVESRGLSMASVAVAWAIGQPGITSAIVGASRPEQLDAALAAAGLPLDDGLKAACDAAWWSLPRRPVIEGYR
jgi:aryl-alcohol dehydrogenase (NADP+)